MPRNRFRLTTLLKLREQVRTERREQLAEAYRADEILERQREAARSEHAELQASRGGLSVGERVDLDRLLEAERYAMVLRAQEELAGRQREAIAEEIERRRQALVQADREVRVLEHLRDRHAARCRAAEAKGEMRDLDEAAQRRFAREEEP